MLKLFSLTNLERRITCEIDVRIRSIRQTTTIREKTSCFCLLEVIAFLFFLYVLCELIRIMQQFLESYSFSFPFVLGDLKLSNERK